MGRTPLSMRWLAKRLQHFGMTTRLFGYFAGVERWDACRTRLVRRISAEIPLDAPYILIGHSLGTVLMRGALPELSRPPLACFLIAPPTVACMLARKFAPHCWYSALNGDMGQRLADPAFMAALPIPEMPTRIYTGTRGIRGRFSPFGDEPNDGILKTSETQLAGIAVREIHATHTFIMRSEEIARDIVNAVIELQEKREDK
jgi:hypothetical protein